MLKLTTRLMLSRYLTTFTCPTFTSLNAHTKVLAISNGPVITSLRLNSNRQQIRDFNTSSSSRRNANTDGIQDETPITWRRLFISLVFMGGLYAVYILTKNKKEKYMEMERVKQTGKASIGGGFELLDQFGNTKTDKDFHDKWVLLYFGFTHCPDVCPDEMEKMGEVVDALEKQKIAVGESREVVPLFITVDPARDGVEEVGKYVKEFHPRMVGLTGQPDAVQKACKAFRVYFSAGPRDDDMDYIVDHTIIIYLIGPDGAFIDYYGQNKTAEIITSEVLMHMSKYKQMKAKSSIKSLL